MILAITIQILVLLIFLLGSAFFSGSETALFSLSRARILEYRKSPDTRAKQLILKLLGDYRATLTTLIMGNQFVNIVISILLSRLMDHLPFGYVVTMIISTLISTVVLLIFGEITPKTAAITHAVEFSNAVALPIFYLKKIMMPLVIGIDKFAALILDCLGRKKPQPLTAEEYDSFLEIAEQAGAFAKPEMELLESAMEMREISVAAIMTSRISTKMLRTSYSAREVKERIRRYKREIYPVIHHDMDDMEFLFSAKEFYLMPPEKQEDWQHSPCMFRSIYIPQQTSLSKALATLYREKQIAAVVVDEFGRCSGLITLKDIIAELVAEIRSTYSQPEFEIIQMTDTTWHAGGMLPLHLLQEATGIEIPDDIDAVTLNGLFTNMLDHLPKHGDTITVNGLKMTAQKIFHHRLAQVIIELEKPQAEDVEDAL